MAATGKRIRVVERPHDGLVRGSEERERVDEAIDPVQVVYVSVGNRVDHAMSVYRTGL